MSSQGMSMSGLRVDVPTQEGTQVLMCSHQEQGGKEMADNAVAINISGDEDIEGCDVEFHDAEATSDEELPMAVGGIAIADEGDDTCGCDVEFDDMDATPDDELPTAEGGVA